MAKSSRSAEGRRQARLTKICLALPDVTRRDSGRHAAVLVRKKTFAYFLNDHHGDGIVSVACKALPDENKALVAAQPTRFYLPSYIGPRGWVALRLDGGKTDWEEVGELIFGELSPHRPTAPRQFDKGAGLIRRRHWVPARSRKGNLNYSAASSPRLGSPFPICSRFLF